jgi:hypothetical protein
MQGFATKLPIGDFRGRPVQNYGKKDLFVTIGNKILNRSTCINYIRGNMNKKLLLVASVSAAVLIVLASFTSVVGFQTTRSTLVDSPLFRIRTQRATDKDVQNVVACEYVGKGKPIMISLPIRDSKTVLIQRVIDRIRKMDDATFNRLMVSAINKLRNKNMIENNDVQKITEALQYLRNNSNDFNPSVVNRDGDFVLFTPFDTPFTIGGFWGLECLRELFVYLFGVLLGLILLIYFLIFDWW